MNVNDIQRLMQDMTDRLLQERASSQMTLGKMIDRLSSLAPDTRVDALTEPHSYRGYYTDLAFERDSGKMGASEMLALCQSAMGRIYQGYKGGDFLMDENTPVWIATYGDTGRKIMAINEDGSIETALDV